jgi:hypothetical protein
LPKRKNLSTDFVSGVVVHWGADASEFDQAAVVRLCEGWEAEVARLFPEGFTDCEGLPEDYNPFDSDVGSYVLHRDVRVRRITWDEQIARLNTLSHAVEALVQELRNADWRLRRSLWGRIAKEFSPDESDEKIRNIRAALVALSNAAPAALARALEERAAGKGVSHYSPFFGLVSSLKETAERNGMRATASNKYITHKGDPAPTSPFVELVWTIMTKAVPANLREHASSKPAMAKAVSRALSTLRQR